MEWILQLHPLPPWMEEPLKTSERACTVRAYLGWKHHEAPWSEYYKSTPSPHGWEMYLKQVRGLAQWELILVGSAMKHHGVNMTTPPTTLPSLPAWNASPSQHCPPVCCHFNTKLKTCACVCVCVCVCHEGGGGEGGRGNLKTYFSCQRKSINETVRTQIRTPGYGVWCDHHSCTNI